MNKELKKRFEFLKGVRQLAILFVFLLPLTSISCSKQDNKQKEDAGPGPLGFSASAGKSQNTILWNAASVTTDSYNIYWSISPGVTKTNGSKIAGVTSPYTHANLTNGTTYYYIGTAVNASGESAASAEVSATPATNNVWTEKASMPTARGMLTSGIVGGKIYVIGGTHGDAVNTTVGTVGTVEEYDTATNTWTTKASMPTPVRLLACGVVNGKIYAISGAQGDINNTTNGTVAEYDSLTNTWATKASMQIPEANITAAVVNDKIYTIGQTVQEYDPLTDTWTTKASMATAREGVASSVVNAKIYAIGGGIRDVNNNIINLNTVEEYDPATDTWTTKSSMPTVRGAVTSGVVNGKIIVIGGFTGTSVLSTVEEYDPVTNSWATKASMPVARYHLTSGVVNGEIYAIGGSNGTTVLSTVEVYTP